jgi:hypothetical protein
MTYEDFLPQEEPGRPLYHVPAGSVDLLMRRIADYRRQQRRRRIAAIALAIICLAGAAYLFAMRRINDVPKVDLAQTHPRLASPAVTPPVPPLAAPQDAVKRETPAPRAPSHTEPAVPQNAMRSEEPAPRMVSVKPQDAAVATVKRPEVVKITVDGKKVRDEAELTRIIRHLDGCTPLRVVMVRDGKSMTYIVHPPHESDSQCTSAAPPK